MNNLTITGNLGADPEMKFVGDGKPVTKLRVAVTTFKGKEKVTDWFDVSVWEKQAEFCNQYLKKGSKVAVTGEVHLRKWDGGAAMEIDKARVESLEKFKAESEEDSPF